MGLPQYADFERGNFGGITYFDTFFLKRSQSEASRVFNLLDARGVISVTERQSYILRVRELAKACGEAWLATEGGGAS